VSRRRGRLAGLVALSLAAALARVAAEEAGPAASVAPAKTPRLPEVLPRAPTVKDSVFSIFVGLVEGNHYGTLTRERLERELVARPGKSRLPYRRLSSVTRLPVVRGEPATLALEFDAPLDVSIPYAILFYHPGSIRASQRCVFREWQLGTQLVSVSDAPHAEGVELQDLHLFGLVEGRIVMDIDAWLDALLGPALDDAEALGLVLFREQGHWIAMGLGYNDKHEGRSGAFDLQEDRIRFPAPASFKAVGRQMRRRLEVLLGLAGPPMQKR
jgi:hypothetical protein